MSAPRGAAKRLIRRVKFRLLFVFAAFGIGAALTWMYREPIFLWLYVPAQGSLSPFEGLPIITSPTEAFSITINLVMKGGMVTAFPVATFSVLTLVSPLLPAKKRRFVLWFFTPALFLCFLAGAAFAYYVMLPTGMKYLLNFGTNISVPAIQLSEYMKLCIALVFWAGVVFELPLLMLLLAKVRLVGYDRFKKFRKYVPLAAFILGAVITPTFDMVNSTLVAVPIILLFEFGLFLTWVVKPRPKPTKRFWRRWRDRMCGCIRSVRRKTWGCIKSLWGGE